MMPLRLAEKFRVRFNRLKRLIKRNRQDHRRQSPSLRQPIATATGDVIAEVVVLRKALRSELLERRLNHVAAG